MRSSAAFRQLPVHHSCKDIAPRLDPKDRVIKLDFTLILGI
jgi:hypothetical protein